MSPGSLVKCGLGLHLLGGIRSSNGRDVVCGRIGTFAWEVLTPSVSGCCTASRQSPVCEWPLRLFWVCARCLWGWCVVGLVVSRLVEGSTSRRMMVIPGVVGILNLRSGAGGLAAAEPGVHPDAESPPGGGARAQACADRPGCVQAGLQAVLDARRFGSCRLGRIAAVALQVAC